MHLFLIASEAPPTPGGIAAYVGNTAAMFRHSGHQLTIFTPGQRATVEQKDGCTWVTIVPRKDQPLAVTQAHPHSDNHPTFPYNVMGDWAALSYQLSETVIDYIRNHGQPDAIESEDYSGLAYFLLQQKLTGCPELQGVPIVLTLHSSQYMLYGVSGMPRYRLADYWVGRMEKFCTLAADGIIAPTHYIAQQAKDALGNTLDIEVIPLPATQSLLNPDHIPDVIPQRGDVVYFGRLEVRKGVVPLVAACQRLWDAGIEFRLTLIGNDTWYHHQGQSMKTYLRQKYGIYLSSGKLILEAAIAPPKLYQRLAKAWCIVVPSIWENFPNTVLESLLLGKVVLATGGVGHEEMLRIPPENIGLLFDWSMPQTFDDQLQDVLAMSVEALQQRGRKIRKAILSLTSPSQILNQRLQHLKCVIEQSTQNKRCEFPSLNYQPHGFIPRPKKSTSPTGISGLISICIFWDDNRKLITETLDSIYESDHNLIEVILLNRKNAKLGKLGILDAVQTQYPQLTVIDGHSQGIAVARNEMAAIASGEYLAFLNAGDLVSPTFYSRTVKIFENYANVGFVTAWLEILNQPQRAYITWNPEFPYLLGQNMIGSCVVVRKSTYLAVGEMQTDFAGSFEDQNFEEYNFWISLCEQGWVGVVVPEFHSCHQTSSATRLGSNTPEHLLCLYEKIAELHPELYQKYHLELHHLLNQNGMAWLWGSPSCTSLNNAINASARELITLLLKKANRVYQEKGLVPLLKRIQELIVQKILG
ncbi:MAG: glycosyltransferase [Spirulinaceae cyanobacterium]